MPCSKKLQAVFSYYFDPKQLLWYLSSIIDRRKTVLVSSEAFGYLGIEQRCVEQIWHVSCWYKYFMAISSLGKMLRNFSSKKPIELKKRRFIKAPYGIHHIVIVLNRNWSANAMLQVGAHLILQVLQPRYRWKFTSVSVNCSESNNNK